MCRRVLIPLFLLASHFGLATDVQLPFQDLPDDSVTDLLQKIYASKQLIVHPQIDSLWEELNGLSQELSPKQQAVKDYMTGAHLADNQLYDRASMLYHRSLKMAVENGWENLEVHNLSSLGALDYYLDNRDSAMVKWNGLVDRIPSESWLLKSMLHSNLGAVKYEKWFVKLHETKTSDLEMAETVKHHFDVSIELLETHNGNSALCRLYGLYSMFLLDNGKEKEAQQLLERANVMAVESKNWHQYHFNLINWGKFFNKKRMFLQAKDSLLKARTFFDSTKVLNQVVHSMNILSQTYDSLGMQKERSDLMGEIIQVKTEMKLERMGRQAQLYRTEFEVFEKEEELRKQAQFIKQQQIENELVTAKKNRWIMVMAATIIIVILLGLLVIQYQRQKAKNEKSLLLIEERENAFSSVIAAQETERKRIAQELHDGIGQQLSGVKMALQHISDSIANGQEVLQTKMVGVIDVVSKSSKEVRQLAHQMLPQVLENQGLIPALEDLFQQSYHQTGIEFLFDTELEKKERFQPELELSLYRGIQEMINNTIKHAEAKQVELHLYKMKGNLIAVYSDNGKGFDIDQAKSGLGLTGLKSRIEHFDGIVSIDSSPGAGVSCTIRIPIQT